MKGCFGNPLAEGVIEKDQFTVRMNRTKARIADIDKTIDTQGADEDRRTHVRSVMSRLAELSSHLQSQLNDADWATKREIVRAPLFSVSRLGQRR